MEKNKELPPVKTEAAAGERAPVASLYPVIFTFRDLVYGNGFVAGVLTRGRALMEHEDEDGWWCYGVDPGSLAASGDTPLEAHAAFRTAFTSVLFDLASEATSLDDFKRTAQAFFAQMDPVDEKRWKDVVEAFRSGRVKAEPPFAELPKLSASTGTFLLVEELTEAHSVTAGNNILPTYSLPLAELAA